MVSKRGWMRILEATVAVMLVSSILVVVYSRQPKRGNNFDEVIAFEKQMLMDITSNYTLRGYALSSNYDGIRSYVQSNIPSYLNFSLKICDLTDPPTPCKNDDYLSTKDLDVFVDEAVISAEVTQYNPKKLRLFVWRI